jgi:toxin FitB
MIILDTNVLSALMQTNPDRAVFVWLDRQPRISIWTTAITVHEIQRGIQVLPLGKRRSRLGEEFDRLVLLLLAGRVASFDSVAAHKSATLVASREMSGKNFDVEDGMIAGIVLAQNATLATRNTKHFDDLLGKVVNPWLD